MQETTLISERKLSVTRWSARIDAVKSPAKKPREILNALDSLKQHVSLNYLINDVDSLITWLKSLAFVLLASF